MIIQGQYRATPPAFADGTAITPLLDAQGRLIVVSGGGGATSDVNVAEWGGVATSLGQNSMAASVPVAIASDQSSLNINVQTWLGSAAPTVSQKTMANSIPVVIASDQPGFTTVLAADGMANPTAMQQLSYPLGFNGATWDRQRSGPSNAATFAGVAAGIPQTSALTMAWDGTNWRRALADASGSFLVRLTGLENTPADGQSNASLTVLTTARAEYYNGTTWDRGRSGLLAAQTGALGWQNNLPGVSFTTAAPTLTNGQVIAHQSDTRGNQLVKQGLPDVSSRDSPSTNMSLDTVTAVVKASAGQVLALWGINTQALGQWLQVHNKAVALVLGDVPIYSFFIPNNVPATQVTTTFFTTAGKNFSTGITFGWSSTGPTYTASAVAAGLSSMWQYV